MFQLAQNSPTTTDMFVRVSPVSANAIIEALWPLVIGTHFTALYANKHDICVHEDQVQLVLLSLSLHLSYDTVFVCVEQEIQEKGEQSQEGLKKMNVQ